MTIRNHESYLNEVAEAIGISADMAERAVSRYQLIGDWLDRKASKITQYNPQVYTQGSFLLGTVIRPIGDANEFDIDLVCELNGNNYDFSMAELKQAVGTELQEYAKYHSMKNEPEDKRRCWTMEYADQAKFHLDVLPALPNQTGYKLLLEQRGHSALAASDALTETAIGITDKELPQYRLKPADWPTSNPKGYAAWFHQRQAAAVMKSREMVLEDDKRGIYASVDEVPQYRVKTPLQKCVQLLKRHRDSNYAGDEDKPISIIITTLSAHAYRGENTLSATLRTVLTTMEQFINERGGTSWVANPINPEENFADKWAEVPRRKQVFKEWLDKAQRDFGAYLNGAYDSPPDGFVHSMSESTVKRVSKSLAIAAPAIASIAERASAEATYNESSGEVSKPWVIR